MYLKKLFDKAVKLHHLRKYKEAINIYKKILKSDPDNIVILNNFGSALNSQENFKLALNFFNKALLIKPEYIDALNNKAISLKSLGQFEEALSIYDTIIKFNPNNDNALNNKANCLRELGKYIEALNYYQDSININPKNYLYYYNCGICFYLMKEFHKAEEFYKKSIHLNPNFVESNYNLSLLQLLLGNYDDGWKNYEWRKKRNLKKRFIIFKNEIDWLGDKDLKDKTIYISKEQALGDYIQYARYLPIIKNLGANLILDTPEPLIPMINSMNFEYTHTNELKKIDFNFHCSIASLPLAFKTKIDSIPSKIPYFFTPIEKKNFWEKKIPNNDKKKIGIKWSGNPNYKDDKNRSISLKYLKPLFELPIDFHSLHIEYNLEDIKLLNQINNLHCHKDFIKGLDNTAGLIEAMDLVISVDTGIVQLTGALGKNIWIMLPFISDHRWLLDRIDSPWFPTAKLYRQTKNNDWENIINNIKKDLIKLIQL